MINDGSGETEVSLNCQVEDEMEERCVSECGRRPIFIFYDVRDMIYYAVETIGRRQ